MIYGVYSMRDVKTGFTSLTLDVSDDSARRNFYHSVAKSDGILFTYAQDFALYHVADFNSDTGVVVPVSPIDLIAQGSDAVKEVSR